MQMSNTVNEITIEKNEVNVIVRPYYGVNLDRVFSFEIIPDSCHMGNAIKILDSRN